jgi:hypothetical protein
MRRGTWTGFLKGSSSSSAAASADAEKRKTNAAQTADEDDSDVIGEGFFYKEGSKMKTWKFRKYNILSGGKLLYFSPTRKLYKGEFDVSNVEISQPNIEDRNIPPEIMSEIGDKAYELAIYSQKIARVLYLIFKSNQEAVLFLYFISRTSTVHNIPVSFADLPDS